MIRAAIVNECDFGLSPAVYQGNLKGIVTASYTNASLRVVEDACEEAVTLAHSHSDLSRSIHITLPNGEPVITPEKILSVVTSDGRFTASLGAFLLK
jgi:predicted glycoside hydrolase/deacetylase ChbG (UPF0249 family)